MKNNSKIRLKNIKKSKTFPNGSKKIIFDKLNMEFDFNKTDIYCFDEKMPYALELLELICGFDTPDAGEVEFKLDSEKLDPHLPYIGRHSSLFEWLTVYENLALLYKNVKLEETVKRQLIDEIIELCGLDGYEHHIPKEESLGFNFRVELARAILVSAPVIVMDAPFRRMKAKDRKDLPELLRAVTEAVGMRFIISCKESDYKLISGERTIFINNI